jgi:hypothetical protein
MVAGDKTSTCAECGAALAPGRVCLDYFHDLLAIEAEVPGAPGGEPHFLAVATYNLQHPSGFVPAALVGLQRSIADVLAGQATVADVLRRARAAAEGPTRIQRRTDTELTEAERGVLRAWPTRWTMTVRDVTESPPARYVERVRAWAMAVSRALVSLPEQPTTRARAG